MPMTPPPAHDRPVDETPDAQLDDLIAAVDLDGLVVLVDTRCHRSDWAGVLRTRDRCAAAARETGRQLWPAATLAEYRLALRAPAPWVGSVLDGESGLFTIGPLSEVAASTHTWAELHPELAPTPLALFVAHERAIRGETIDPTSVVGLPPVLDIPAELQPWEPQYPMSVYTETGAEHPHPPAEPGNATDHHLSDREPTLVHDDDTTLAFRQLVETWTTHSTGRAEVVCVEGDHLDAIAALGPTRVRVTPISAQAALARLAWAGASGGAQGRRRGMAMGRFSTWWLLGALGDLADDWPPHPDDVTDLLDELDWYQWDAHEPETGWQLQLAVTNRVEHTSWAFHATDFA